MIYDMIWYMMYDIWYDMIRDMIQYRIYDMIWYDMIWYMFSWINSHLEVLAWMNNYIPSFNVYIMIYYAYSSLLIPIQMCYCSTYHNQLCTAIKWHQTYQLWIKQFSSSQSLKLKTLNISCVSGIIDIRSGLPWYPVTNMNIYERWSHTCKTLQSTHTMIT